MKRVLSFLCAVAMVLTMCTFYMGEALSVAAEGEQIPAENVVDIYSYEQLLTEMANSDNVGKTLRFANDLEASKWTFEAVSGTAVTGTNTETDETVTISVANDDTFGTATAGALPENTAFGANLVDGVNIDGNGYAIKGLVVTGEQAGNVCLINTIGANSTVKDVVIADSVFAVAGKVVRPLANDVRGKVIACETEADVTVALRWTTSGEVNISGLLGQLSSDGYDPTVSNDTTTLTLQQVYDAIQDGTFEPQSEAFVDDCINRASVFGYATGNVIMGGVANRIYFSNATIRNSTNYGDLTASSRGSIGGITGYVQVGRNGQTIGYYRNVNIINCANYGDVTGGTNAAGIIGESNASSSTGGQYNVALCYNAGVIGNGEKFGIYSTNTNPYDKTKTADGYGYGARLTGGTAFNFTNIVDAATTPQAGTDLDYKLPYNSEVNRTVSFSYSQIFKSTDGVSATAFFSKTNVWEILNTASKYFDGVRPWKNGANGPEINYEATNSPVEISTENGLYEVRDMFNYCYNLGSNMEIKATLTADIDLNKGVTFGFDADKNAGIVKKGGTTYYLGYGANTLSSADAGLFYTTSDGTTYTPVDAATVGLTSWTPFASALSPAGNSDAARCFADKVTLRLDGNGHTIHGLYINNTTVNYVGFASIASNVHFANLTLDGIIFHSKTHWRYGAGAFIGTANTDCTIVNCVNNVNVLTYNGGSYIGPIGGIVGWMGTTDSSNFVYERMPNRICKVIGCVNNGTIANGTNSMNRYLGGIVGLVTQGEVKYCTNTGDIDLAVTSGVGNNIAGIAVVQPSYNTSYTLPGNYVTGTVPPYQTTIRIIGNSNSGHIPNIVYDAAAVFTDLGKLSDGAWLVTAEGPKTVLPSEVVISNNIGICDDTNTAKIVRDSTVGTAITWTDGTIEADLTATLVKENNVYVTATAMADAASLNSNLKKAYIKADGYEMFYDYDYSNKGIPHAVKMSEGFVYTTDGSTNAITAIEIGDAEALMLLNDIVNAFTSNDAVVGEVAVTDLYDAYAKGVSIADYLTAARNGAPQVIDNSLSGVTVKLTADIDLGGAKWRPLGDDVPYFNVDDVTTPAATMAPTYFFAGAFDGNHYTVSNFKFIRESGVGFFGSAKGGSITRVKFADVNVNAGEYAAIAVCFSSEAVTSITVKESCSITATGGHIAGIAAQHNGQLDDNVNGADITTESGSYIGGIAGQLVNGQIKYSTNTGDITMSGAGQFVGGIAGFAKVYASLDRDINTGDVYAPNAERVGGIIGRYGSTNKLSNFENSGDITGKNFVGGILGFKSEYGDITLENNNNTGNVTGTSAVGGIFGYSRMTQATGCQNDGTITGNGATGATVSSQLGSAYGVGGIGGAINSGTISSCTNNGAIDGTNTAAGIIGWTQNTVTIQECTNNGDVYDIGDETATAQYIAGIVGKNISAVTLTSNTNTGDITGASRVGGIIAVASEVATLSGNTNSGAISATGNFVGGIAGRNDKAGTTLNGDSNSGTVTGAQYVGGIMGYASSATTFTNCENSGAVNGSTMTAGIVGVTNAAVTVTGAENSGAVTGTQYIAGIVGTTNVGGLTVEESTNSGEISAETIVAGIVAYLNGGTAAAPHTIEKCENTGTIKSTRVDPANDSARVTYIAGIVSEINGTGDRIIQNVNRATIDNGTDLTWAGGIVGMLRSGGALVEGNVNYGDIIAQAYASGIVARAHAANTADVTVIRGNVNYGDYTIQLPSLGNGGIVAVMRNPGATEVCYNVNFGTTNKTGYATGGVTGDTGTDTTKIKTSVYGNIDASKSIEGAMTAKVIGTLASGFATNNYGLGIPTNATFIDGKTVTESQFKTGRIAYIINHLSYTAGNFDSESEEYLWKSGTNEMAHKTVGETATYSASVGLITTNDYMVQRIGIDDYPLPKYAAELIYAEQGAEDVAAEIEKAEASVQKGEIYEAAAQLPANLDGLGETEQLVGYIDSSKNVYKPGSTVDAKVYLYPLVVDFYTAFGAGARTTTPTGIRYQTIVSEEFINIMGDDIASKFGTIIIPTDYVEKMMGRDDFDHMLDAGKIIATTDMQKINIVNNGWASADYYRKDSVPAGYKTYMGSIVGILDQNSTKDFSGISYFMVDYVNDDSDEVAYFTAKWQTAKNGEEFVDGAAYSSAANSRNVAFIAYRAINDDNSGLSNAAKAQLQPYADKYVVPAA